MKELLTYVARNLVDHPEQVSVNEIQSDGETILELRVAPEDTGKVIGRQGRIAKEIRTLIRAPWPSGPASASRWRSSTDPPHKESPARAGRAAGDFLLCHNPLKGGFQP